MVDHIAKRWHKYILPLLIIAVCVAGNSYSTQLRNLYITGVVSNETAKVTNGGLDVNIQDQHTRALDLYFVRADGAPTTLASPAVVDQYELTLASAAGFVDAAYVGVVDGSGGFYFATQLGAPAANVITLDSLIDQAYVVGSVVLNLTRDMNVDGSVSPQTFQIGPIGTTIEIDIVRIMGVMFGSTAMDDGEFGDLPALTRGCVLRVTNGVKTNNWNVKSNGELALIGFDFMYPDTPPAGQNSARFRITYGGQTKHGVTVRLMASETLEFIIQDDLTGMQGFNMMAQGHVVE